MNRNIVVTMCIGDYFPELMKITLSNLEEYAKRIHSDFYIIEERKFSDWPITYEKIQIYEISKKYEWAAFIDADTLISKHFGNIFTRWGKDTISFNHNYYANTQIKRDKYFWRDGRNVGIAGNFLVASEWCNEIWQPQNDLSKDEILNNIISPHIIDEYIFSRNLAKFGFKYCGVAPHSYEQNLICHLGTGKQNEKELIEKAKEFINKY